MAVDKKILEETLKNPKGLLKDILDNKKLKEILVWNNETIDLTSIDKILEHSTDVIDVITSENWNKDDKKYLTFLLLKYKETGKYAIKDGGVTPKDVTIWDFIIDLNETPNQVFPPDEK